MVAAMNLSLPERTENAIKALVQQGAYPTPEKAIEAGIKALQHQSAANNPVHVDPERLQRRKEAAHMQIIEGNPLTQEDETMFEMFDRKGWDFEQRAKYINEQALVRQAQVTDA